MNATAVDGRAGIDAALVKRLIAAQFPQWAGLPVVPVEIDGWDNRTYRLGDDMTVRLPTAAGYVPAVAKENEWLPRLAPSLPVAVPPILGMGAPGEGYPFPWSVRGWLPGETAGRGRVDDLARFAVSVAEFVHALQRCDTAGGPPAGEASTGAPRPRTTTRRPGGACPRCAGTSTPAWPPPCGRPQSPPSGAGGPCGSTATSPTGTCWWPTGG
ncbi:phosphotransferase [Nonomuraea antimicrobica]